MWYGSSVLRHGRSRPWRPYHVSSRCRKRRRSAGGRHRRKPCADASPSAYALQASHIIAIQASVKIYTRTGDTGETSLFDGTRVHKSDTRVDAYGEVDELNAWLGVVRAFTLPIRHSIRSWSRSSAICSRSAPSSPIPPTRLASARHQGRARRRGRRAPRGTDRLARDRAASARAIHSPRRLARRRRAARGAHGLPPRRAPHGRARTADRSGAAALREPPVGPALRHGPRGQSSRRGVPETEW